MAATPRVRYGLVIVLATAFGFAAGVVGFAAAMVYGPRLGLRTAAAPPAAAATPTADAHGARIATAVKRIEPAVVTIDTFQSGERVVPPLLRDFLGDTPDLGEMPRGSGSGFIVDAREGHVVTNQHVVEKADRITVTLNDGRELEAKLVGSDRLSDIAVLKVPADKLPEAPLGVGVKLEQGHWVIAIGNPFREFSDTVTVGVVSAVGRSMVAGGREYRNLVQTDAAINMGNSGGPLCDIEGRVIGVNSAIFSLTGTNLGIGFAIPIDDAMGIARNLIAHGGVPWLGVSLLDLTPELAKTHGLSADHGVLVRDAIAGGPAAKAGVQARDLLVSVDGKPVKSTAELNQIVLGTTIGRETPLVIRREGKELTLRLTIGARPMQ